VALRLFMVRGFRPSGKLVLARKLAVFSLSFHPFGKLRYGALGLLFLYLSPFWKGEIVMPLGLYVVAVSATNSFVDRARSATSQVNEIVPADRQAELLLAFGACC